ncbi:MAG: helix-turn-helix domain-containing protein [Oscillospiraceae bacterium]|nr:helix-turn-helix domain-containing protein [Oscillospiraceae bacterium]
MARTKTKTLRNKYSNSVLTQNLRKRINPENTRELAEACNVSESAVRLWSSGATRPDIDNIPTIARVLNVPIDYLFGYESEKITAKSKDEVQLLNNSLEELFTDSILSYESLAVKEQLYDVFQIITTMFIMLSESGIDTADTFIDDIEKLLLYISSGCIQAETASIMIDNKKAVPEEFYAYNYEIQREADEARKKAVELVTTLITNIQDDTVQNLARVLEVNIDNQRAESFNKDLLLNNANRKRRDDVTNG